MTQEQFKLAGEIIWGANRGNPADVVLRETLKHQRRLSPADQAAVSRAVFAYYRWFGWLANLRGIEARIERALALADRFEKNPFSLHADDLRAKSVPTWALDEMEVGDAWLRSLQREPHVWLRARVGQGRALAKKLGAKWNSSTPDALIYESNRSLFEMPEFHAGEFEIQDLASQMVGWLCDAKPGETWWDACAGEGGKLLHLSDLMENKGLIWASDRAAWRLQKLKRRTARAKVFNYRAALWDGGAKLPTKTKFDGVLVDAPCSGLGTWQRNPHARWTTTPEDVRELAEVQKRLLENAAPSVKPGGKLIYAVCTLTRAETGEVTEAFNKAHLEFEPMPLPVVHLGKESGRVLTNAATFTIWPQDFGGNGMFVAAWQRKG
jgi:16S rRNA (cytosine967-C5)-methyltransferase